MSLLQINCIKIGASVIVIHFLQVNVLENLKSIKIMESLASYLCLLSSLTFWDQHYTLYRQNVKKKGLESYMLYLKKHQKTIPNIYASIIITV